MIKTFINGQENGVITFKGDTEPCAVYVNGERQDNISYIPQSVEGVNSVEYSSEYKKNIRTMQIDGNTVQDGTPTPETPQPINNANDDYIIRLPIEYQEVEYIESTGTQYINVDKPVNNFEAECARMSEEYQYTGCFISSEVQRCQLGIGADKVGWGIGNDTYISNYGSYITSVGSGFQHYKITKDGLYIDGTKVVSYNVEYPTANSGGVLFGRRDTRATTTGLTNPGIMKIKSAKFYNGNALVFDFVPCYRKVDGVIGMYDLVSNTLYTNDGTGTFLKGKNIGMSLELSVNGNITTIAIPPSVTVGGTEIPLRFAKYTNADYLLLDRTNGTVKYYQYSTEGDATKPLSEQAENNPPLEYDITSTDLGQALLNLPTENQTNIITITSTPSVSKLSVNYAKYGGTQ